MAMFSESQNTRILGGNFAAVDKGDVHFHMGAIPGQRGWDLLQKNIAPGAFHDAAERPDPPRCHPRTRQAILTKIMTWIKDLDTQYLILWLYGPAGSGKTAIAQTIAEMCSVAGILASSFFFSRLAAGRSDKTHLFSTMAFELSIMIPEIRHHVESAVEKDPSIFSRSLATQMQKLIVTPLNAAAKEIACKEAKTPKETKTPSPRLVIVDGLDECNDSQAQREIVEIFSKFARQLSYPLVFLVASRPEYEIREVFSTNVIRSLTFAIALDNTYRPDDDIKIFLQSKFDENKERHPSRDNLPSLWPSEEDMNQLVEKASGQFIYASTVMKYIESHRHHPMKRLKIVLGLSNPGNDTPFAELDALYRHIFQSVERIEETLEVLTLLILGSEYQPLLKGSFTELLLEYEAGDVQTILSDMHALVHVPKSGEALQVHHASLRDFLLDQSRSEQFFIDAEKAHANLAIRWINYTALVKPEFRDEYGPYHFVLRHCVRTKHSPDLLDALKRFDVGRYVLFFWRTHHHIYLMDLPPFIEWLSGQEPPNHPIERLVSYRDAFDNWFLGELMKFPSETRSYVPVMFVFAGSFHEQFQEMWEILISSTDVKERIQHPADCGWFWHHCSSFCGSLGVGEHAFTLFQEFFADPSRAGYFYVNEAKYADLAEKFTTFIYRPRHFDAIKTKPTDRYDWIVQCTKVALKNLPIILQKAERRPKLARYLRDKSLQSSSSGVLYQERKDASFGVLRYIRECKVQFREHVHFPEYDFCAICSSGEQDDPAALPDPPEGELSCQIEPQPCNPAKVEEVPETPIVAPSEVAPSATLPATHAKPVILVAGLDTQIPEEVVCRTPSSSRSIRKSIKDWVKNGGKSSR